MINTRCAQELQFTHYPKKKEQFLYFKSLLRESPDPPLFLSD